MKNIKNILKLRKTEETNVKTNDEKTFDEKYYEGNEKLEELVHRKLDELLDDEKESEFEDYKILEALFRIRNEKQKVENDSYYKGIETDRKTKNRVSIDNIVSCGTVAITIIASILIENRLGILIPRSASAITNKIKFKSA